MKARPEENFPKPSMDQKGQISVKFTNKINMPQYLKKEIDQVLTTN
jgi:hypothetical protein